MAEALEDLSSDLLRLIASFLSGRDALRLSFSSSSLRSALPLVPLPPLPLQPPILRNREVWSDERGDRPCPSRYLLPILFPDRTHSILVRCQWVDQGWGNRKGQLFIGAERAGPSGVPSTTNAEPPRSQQQQQQQMQQQTLLQLQHMQRQHQMLQQQALLQLQQRQQQQQELEERTQLLVETPQVAPHEVAPVSLEIASASIFAAGLRFSCRLWYKVGAGGGHNLQVMDLKVEVLVYDDFDDAKNKEGIVRKPFLQSYRAILRCMGDSHVASRFLDPVDALSRSARSLASFAATQWGVYPDDYSVFPSQMHGLQTAPNHPTQHNSEATNPLVGTFLRLFLAVVRFENELLCRDGDKQDGASALETDDTLKTSLAQMGLTATDKGCLRAAQEIALKLQSL